MVDRGHSPAEAEFRVSGGRVLLAPQVLRPVLLRLTLGPGASLPPDLTEDPRVAHILDPNDKGYVVMDAANQRMTLQERSDHYQVEKAPCPHFELQLSHPSDRFLSIHLPRTNLDKEELTKAHNIAVSR